MVNSRTSSRVERSNPAHEDERHGSELFLAGYVHDISKDRTTEMGINAKGKEKEEVPAPLKLPEPIRRKDTNEESRKRESDRRNFRRSYP
jgi:hypothetical protein